MINRLPFLTLAAPALLVLFAAQAGCSRLTALNDGRHFGIDPTGQPQVSLPALAAVPDDPLLAGVTIQHHLEFDGLRYYSRVSIPVLDSLLVSTGNSTYRWRRFDGQLGVLRVGHATPMLDGEWTLERISASKYLVQKDYRKERYLYENCRPTQAIVAGVNYRLDYMYGKPVAIERVFPDHQMLVEAHYNGKAVLDGLEVQGVWYDIAMNENGSIATVNRSVDHAEILTLSYKDELWVGGKWKGGTVHFTWGTKALGYSKTVIPVPPVVVDDGQYGYSIAETADGLRVIYQDKDSGLKGGWIYNPPKNPLPQRQTVIK